MITKKKFIAAIDQFMDEEYLYIYLVRKNKFPCQRKYFYADLKIFSQEQPNKTREEIFALAKEEMWEVAFKEMKPQTMKDYLILKCP
jgi:hypothetical protein